MMNTVNRPRFLDLRKIRLPLPGIVSILHRISGVLMVLAIPFLIYLFDLSLRNSTDFAAAADCVDSVIFKLVATVILWSITHHFYAGIRYLLLDIDIGVERKLARASSTGVFILSILTTLLFLGVIW